MEATIVTGEPSRVRRHLRLTGQMSPRNMQQSLAVKQGGHRHSLRLVSLVASAYVKKTADELVNLCTTLIK